MKNKLQLYFPMIRTREEILDIIHSQESLRLTFMRWEEKYQKEFLDFCTGVKGVKTLYDSFAKELLNPETVPERLNELLSLLLEKEVQIIQVLPNDNTRIADESSLLVMDIVVKLEDGSIANVEIQKIGYSFPGQRSACYSADLLLRQYKMVRGCKDAFSYRDIKDVYTIVFFEKSAKEFQKYPNTYIHYFQQVSNTGLELPLLQKYVYIPLDIFCKNQHNKDIQSRLEAWLTFLGSDNPEDIISVIKQYPDFKIMYEHVYEICQNVEKVMGMFSKELQELDRNTVRYMIDEMQNEIDQQREELDRNKEELDRNRKLMEEKDCALQRALERIEELERKQASSIVSAPQQEVSADKNQ